MYFHLWATQSMNKEFKIQTAQNSKNLRLDGQTSFESRTSITCFGHICNHPHGQCNHTLKYINMV